jgi:hypothetical protein
LYEWSAALHAALLSTKKERGLGTALVTILVTQNLVSSVIACSSASRDASLKALDVLELARPSSKECAPVWGCQGLRSNRAAAPISFFGAVLYGSKQAYHNRVRALGQAPPAPKVVQDRFFPLGRQESLSLSTISDTLHG